MRRVLWLIFAMVTAGSIFAPLTVEGANKDRFYFERHTDAYWRVHTDQKVVAFTFDDGPDPTYTPKVLRLLHSYGQTATFFVIGQKVDVHPEIVQTAIQLGNELGNHTFSHIRVKNLSEEQLAQEINRTNNAVLEATGHRTVTFRPPRGHYDERIISTANRMGYQVVMWSWDEDTKDWKQPGVASIVSHVLDHIHPGDIILFHDGTGHSQQTVDALRLILPRLRELGYRSVTISELIKLQTPRQRDD